MINKEKIYNFIGVIALPLALFLVSPYWNSIFSEKKSLEYQVLNKFHLREEDDNALTKNWPKLKLIYNSSTIDDATVIKFSLTNSGDIPIRAGDFEGNLIIETDSPDNILEYSIRKTCPTNLSPKLNIVNNTLELQHYF